MRLKNRLNEGKPAKNRKDRPFANQQMWQHTNYHERLYPYAGRAAFTNFARKSNSPEDKMAVGRDLVPPSTGMEGI